MTRGLSVAQINASTSSHRVVAPLVEMLFDGGTLRLSPFRWDITVGADTYLAAPIAIEKIRESSSSMEGMQVTMNGLDPAIIAIVTAEPWQGRTCRILKAYLQADSNQVIGAPVQFFIGRFRNFVVSEDNQSANVTAFVEHYDAELQRANPTRLTDADQQRLFTGDLGCQYAASYTDKSIVWPSKEAQKFKLHIPSTFYQRRFPNLSD